MKLMTPKYNIGNIVQFKQVIDGQEMIFSGKIFIVDRNGIFDDDNEIYYDILVNDHKMHEDILYKHIPENMIL